MLEIAVEFFARLLFPLDRVTDIVEPLEATVENYTCSSVFPLQIEGVQKHP